jgi:hypothetical protein
MAYRRGDNDRPEVLGHGFIEATTWGEGMSGDHNMHQKPRSYLDDFECPRCGHCCKAEWIGLTDDEVTQAMYRADAIITGPMQFRFAKEIEIKLREKNT